MVVPLFWESVLEYLCAWQLLKPAIAEAAAPVTFWREEKWAADRLTVLGSGSQAWQTPVPGYAEATAASVSPNWGVQVSVPMQEDNQTF